MSEKLSKEDFKRLAKALTAEIREDGKELHNPIPAAINTGLNRPATLKDTIQRLIKVEVSENAALQGQETFEEANNFEMNDPFEREVFSSKYELMDDDDEFGPQDEIKIAHHSGAKPEDSPVAEDQPPIKKGDDLDSEETPPL